MLKKLIPTAAIILFIITVSAPSSLSAAAFSVGATTWYTAWDCDLEGDSTDLEYSPSLLYGPVISASFTPELSMSFVFLYGVLDGDNESSPDTTRYDGDLALNYRINSWLKLFAGVKYIAFSWSDDNGDGKHQALGPGAGLSSVIHMGGNFFLLGYLSGLYLKGEETYPGSSGDYHLKAEEYGYNASLSIAWYIPSASTTISLGGRYQYIHIDYKDNEGPENDNDFYGVTLTAVYSFNI